MIKGWDCVSVCDLCVFLCVRVCMCVCGFFIYYLFMSEKFVLTKKSKKKKKLICVSIYVYVQVCDCVSVLRL